MGPCQTPKNGTREWGARVAALQEGPSAPSLGWGEPEAPQPHSFGQKHHSAEKPQRATDIETGYGVRSSRTVLSGPALGGDTTGSQQESGLSGRARHHPSWTPGQAARRWGRARTGGLETSSRSGRTLLPAQDWRAAMRLVDRHTRGGP